MGCPKTLNVQVGKKLNDKTKPDIMAEVEKVFNLYGVLAIQIGYDTIRVTFMTDEGLRRAKELSGVHLFGLWCPILGGGPPVTIVHLFDYPFEEDNSFVSTICKDFGEIKKVKNQTYLANNAIYMGTRLVSIALKGIPPRGLMINGYVCRIWYKGQPLICNLCGVQGHRSAVCPNKDKCRRCGEVGHFARTCTKAWATNCAPSSAAESSASADAAPGSSGEAALVADPLPLDTVLTPQGDELAPVPRPVLAQPEVDSHPSSGPSSAPQLLSSVEPNPPVSSWTDGQRVPDDSVASGSVSMGSGVDKRVDAVESAAGSRTKRALSDPVVGTIVESESSGSVPMDSEEITIDSVESVSSGTKRALSDPDAETNASQSILVDVQDAQHLMKKIRRIFNRKGPSVGIAKSVVTPGRHALPPVVSNRPLTRSKSK